LLGRTAEAQTELRAAAAAGGYVGEAAATFQQRLAVGLPEALAALLRMPPEPHDPQIPPMAHLQAADLAPPEVTLQAYLTRNPETAVVDLLTASGQEVPRPHLAVDLDGDGRQEIWGMIGYESYLGVQTEQGWRVTALGQWTRTPELVPSPDGHGRLIKFGPDLSSNPLMGWNGGAIVIVTPSGIQTRPLLPPPVPRCKSDD
jgi:hypothetical protein